MTTQIDYEAIARENGYTVSSWGAKWFWWPEPDSSWDNYSTPEEAYKACCVENNLVEGEE